MAEFRINGVLQASYTYDAMGRQAIRPLTSPTPVTIHSVFDSDGRRIAEYNETSGALIREYVWNGWDPVAVIEGGVISFVRTDHIGRPVFATNASGVKVWTATYQPFGGVHTSTGALPSARFPGQWFQSESGLHQNWMRDYDPTTGRYLEADPLGLVDGASVYGYAAQNPMTNADPRGEQVIILRPGVRVSPGTRPWAPRGPFDIGPPFVPKDTPLPDKFVDHPKAKEQYRKYKQFCNNPPPDTGERCTDLLNRAEYLFKCAKMKDDWDNEWLPGRHKANIAEMREAAKKYLADHARTCASCPVGELPMSRPVEG
jgi:RHS repeat-associated protein